MYNFRKDFPQIRDGFAYLDNAATTLKPRCVTNRLLDFYASENATPFRGLYNQSITATNLYEEARKAVSDFVGAKENEVVFTSGATDSLNKLALGLKSKIRKGDEIIVSRLEHHSNLLPWRKLAEEKGAKILILEDEKIEKLITEKTKILAITAYSNVFGENKNLEQVLKKAKNLIKIIDATQAAASITLKDIDADYLAFSAHKIYGPMGIGVLVGKNGALKNLDIVSWGGGMVDAVHDDKIINSEIPHCFEAGTPNVASAVAFAEALKYFEAHKEEIWQREKELAHLAYERLSKVDKLTIYSEPNSKIISFNIEGVHPHDAAQILADDNIAVRAGYHCAQPLLEKLKIGPVVRVSLAFYNNEDEIEKLATSLSKIWEHMRV